VSFYILRHKPDILFLDIQLSDDTSLGLLSRLEKMMKLPFIIFTTAYNDPGFLLQAIKFSAVDYLLKPVRIADLAEALQKVRTMLSQPVAQAVEKETSALPADENYAFRTVSGMIYGNHEDIYFFRADGNYSILFHSQGEDLILERLGNIAGKLDPQYFLRAGRSIILNKKYIYKVDKNKSLCILKAPGGKSFRIPLSEAALKAIYYSSRP